MVAMAATVLGGFSESRYRFEASGRIRSGVKVGGEVLCTREEKSKEKKEQDGIDVCCSAKASRAASRSWEPVAL